MAGRNCCAALITKLPLASITITFFVILILPCRSYRTKYISREAELILDKAHGDKSVVDRAKMVADDQLTDQWRRLVNGRLDTNNRYRRSFATEFSTITPTARATNAITNTTSNAANSIVDISSTNLTDNTLEQLFYKNYTTDNILTINMSSNSLQMFDFRLLTRFEALKHLNLYNNHIESVNNISFDQLKSLNLSCNRVRTFKSVAIQSLTTLDLSCNLLNDTRNIDFSYLNTIEFIDLSCNNLTQVDRQLFQNTKTVRIVNLANNWLVNISQFAFRNLKQIEILILAFNNIIYIERNTFAYLPSLQYLDLSHNRLHSTSIAALQGIPDLIELSLGYNANLRQALQGFVASWSLKELDLSGTSLCSLPAALAQSVRTLNLTDNFLQVIRCGDLDSYPLLQTLILTACHIADIEDDAIGRLEILTTLHLNNNRLIKIPISLPSSLVHLRLQNNRIVDVQPAVLVHLVNLETLDLSQNQIIYLPGLPLPRLLTLRVRASGVCGVDQSIVKQSPHLKVLWLDGNPVKCADLLAVAEWATPCRGEARTFEHFFDTNTHEQMCHHVNGANKLNSFNSCYNCRRHRPSVKPYSWQSTIRNSTSQQLNECQDEQLIASDSLRTTNKSGVLQNTTTHDTKLKEQLDFTALLQSSEIVQPKKTPKNNQRKERKMIKPAATATQTSTFTSTSASVSISTSIPNVKAEINKKQITMPHSQTKLSDDHAELGANELSGTEQQTFIGTFVAKNDKPNSTGHRARKAEKDLPIVKIENLHKTSFMPTASRYDKTLLYSDKPEPATTKSIELKLGPSLVQNEVQFHAEPSSIASNSSSKFSSKLNSTRKKLAASVALNFNETIAKTDRITPVNRDKGAVNVARVDRKSIKDHRFDDSIAQHETETNISDQHNSSNTVTSSDNKTTSHNAIIIKLNGTNETPPLLYRTSLNANFKLVRAGQNNSIEHIIPAPLSPPPMPMSLQTPPPTMSRQLSKIVRRTSSVPLNFDNFLGSLTLASAIKEDTNYIYNVQNPITYPHKVFTHTITSSVSTKTLDPVDVPQNDEVNLVQPSHPPPPPPPPQQPSLPINTTVNKSRMAPPSPQPTGIRQVFDKNDNADTNLATQQAYGVTASALSRGHPEHWTDIRMAQTHDLNDDRSYYSIHGHFYLPIVATIGVTIILAVVFVYVCVRRSWRPLVRSYNLKDDDYTPDVQFDTIAMDELSPDCVYNGDNYHQPSDVQRW